MTQKYTLDEEFEHLITEGVHDKGIFKAVFLAGGPGSGKDYVMSHTLEGHGLTEINSDKALEYLMDKNHLNKQMPEDEEEARNHIRKRAKNMTELRQLLALHGRNGLIINGTGDDHKKVRNVKKGLEKLGYDTSMIMVHTDDEVSRKRNIERGQRGGRTVPESIRKSKWDAVQAARQEHAKTFGNNYHEYDNSLDHKTAAPEEIKQKKDELQNLFVNMHNFVNSPVKSEKSQKWIAKELVNKNRLPIPRKGSEKLPNPESQAAQQAADAGLHYYGQGRYGKNGKVTHYALQDNLTEVEKDEPKQKPKKKINEEFTNFITEAVSVTITGDSPEEVNTLLMNLGKAQQQKNDNTFSDKKESVTLGKPVENVNISTEGITLTNSDIQKMLEEETPIMDTKGNPRHYLLRANAAKEAHLKNGTVYPHESGKGYVVKIKQRKKNYDKVVEETSWIREETRTNSGSVTGTNFLREDTQAASAAQETLLQQKQTQVEYKHKKLTLSDFKTKTKDPIDPNRQVNCESIDKGIEPGLSMATGGESPLRTTGKIKKKDITNPINELTGDETTMSIGDQKEDELKKKGINLATFKAKRLL